MARHTPQVAGFQLAGIASGIKGGGIKSGGEKGKPVLDLGLILADQPAVAAAVFTRNRVRAAPVLVAEERVRSGRVQAVLVNSGNANACTGKKGMLACRRTTALMARELGIDEALILPASTGVIGQLLPAERIEEATPRLVNALSDKGADAFARAILTTDRWPKMAMVKADLGRGRRTTVLGIAKGAGMIHPNMATTLGFVLTDAPLTAAFLRQALRHAVSETFNLISVDGEMSTNDTLVAMASGRALGEPLRTRDAKGRRFSDALTEVLEQLSRSIVRDGEGAERVVSLEVVGATSDRVADRVARAVAGSLLVKTAIHGCDPNWGRILSAAGASGAVFDPDQVEIRVGEVVIARRGLAAGGTAEKRASRVMRRPEFSLLLKLGTGKCRARRVFCDLGHEYVRINADYRS